MHGMEPTFLIIRNSCGESIGRMYKRIFLDTNPIIYLVENQQPYADKVLDFIVQGLDDKSEFYTSTITDAGCKHRLRM